MQVALVTVVTAWASMVALSSVAVVKTEIVGGATMFWNAVAQKADPPLLLCLMLLLPCVVPSGILFLLSSKEAWLVTYTLALWHSHSRSKLRRCRVLEAGLGKLL